MQGNHRMDGLFRGHAIYSFPVEKQQGKGPAWWEEFFGDLTKSCSNGKAKPADGSMTILMEAVSAVVVLLTLGRFTVYGCMGKGKQKVPELVLKIVHPRISFEGICYLTNLHLKPADLSHKQLPDAWERPVPASLGPNQAFSATLLAGVSMTLKKWGHYPK